MLFLLDLSMNKNIDAMPPGELMEYIESLSDKEFHQFFVERGLFEPLNELELQQWIKEMSSLREGYL
jgi:hypothetical protein